MIIFETERLVVRKYEFEQDAENFFLLNGDEEVMRYIRPAKNREECDKFLKEIILKADENPGIGRWAAIDKKSKIFVGSFAIIPIENTELIQLGYAFLRKFWGMGYASELTRGGIDYYFSTTPENEIYAVTEVANTASQKVLLKNGFKMHSTRKEEEKELLQYIRSR